MDIHEFTAHDGPFSADEFADDAEAFGTIDELDLPERRAALLEIDELDQDSAGDVA